MFDLIITNAEVVRPGQPDNAALDIGVTDGRITLLESSIDSAEGRQVFDATGLLAFPGAVDAHMHFGIYNPLSEDITSESRAAALGGVTTGLSYIRSGQYYLNRGGPYGELYPSIVEMTDGRSHIDYAFHLAPMMSEHIDEIEDLVSLHGVTSFKIFMFYGAHGLHGRSDDQSQFLMTPAGERYDYAHFEFIMRGVRRAMDTYPHWAEHISLSMHCETAEIMTAYTKMVEDAGQLTGLEAYHESRPPHSEGLAVAIASYLAHETNCVNINLLHLSSAKAIDSAMRMAETYPSIDFRREVTVAHLLADINTANGSFGKVNPPIRPRADVEALWDAMLAGHIDWVVSDHACCRAEMKVSKQSPDDIFLAKSGFGGTEYLMPGVLSEGRERGLSDSRIAELLCWNPAQRFGLLDKGTIAVGYAADVVLVDANETWVVRADESESTQGYSPLEGHELTGRVKHVFMRGHQILENGNPVGPPTGRLLARPTPAP